MTRRPPSSRLRLTPTQRHFVEWNAQRLGISLRASRQRYERSRALFPAGHAGTEFRHFNVTAHELLSVFSDDSEHEVMRAYHLHAPLHFLRMLTYAPPRWAIDHPIVQSLLGRRRRIRILDYGCGLAHASRSLAHLLVAQGRQVQLLLADIPTLRKDFLRWVCQRENCEATFIDCTDAAHPPRLPACDVCIATEFFEHVHRPLRHLRRVHTALRPGGFLQTNVADHLPEFFHVHPRLGDMRRALRQLHYQELVPHRLFRKPSPREVD